MLVASPRHVDASAGGHWFVVAAGCDSKVPDCDAGWSGGD
jgi:hypothetical protein